MGRPYRNRVAAVTDTFPTHAPVGALARVFTDDQAAETLTCEVDASGASGAYFWKFIHMRLACGSLLRPSRYFALALES